MADKSNLPHSILKNRQTPRIVVNGVTINETPLVIGSSPSCPTYPGIKNIPSLIHNVPTPKPIKFKNSGEALKAVGEFGAYQIYVCVIMQYSAIIGAGAYALINFGQLFPTYHCPNIDLKSEDYQSTHSMPFECAIVHNCTNRSIIKRYFRSMADEWFLVCERSLYLKIILLGSTCGRILGAILGGHIGDYFGRKTVLYPSQFGVCIISALSTACTKWYTFAICSSLCGLFLGIGECTAFVLIMEITSTKYRWIPNCCMQPSFQFPIVALVAYLTGNWRMYLIIINVIFAPLLVFYLLFVESPRYLIYHEHFVRAAKTLSDLASDRWNNIEDTTDIVPSQFSKIPTRTTEPKDPKYPTPLELFRTLSRAKLTITLMVAIFFRSIVSNLFITDASDESGNPFINITLYGVVRIWVPFFIVFTDLNLENFGRRTCFLLFTGSLFICLLIAVIMAVTDTLDGVSLRVIGLIGASLGASGSSMAISQCIIEAYPTAIRGIAYGWIEAVDGMGSLVAPFIMGLSSVWSQLPSTIMFLLAVVSIGGGYMVLPETKFVNLKDGIHEMQIRKNSKTESEA